MKINVKVILSVAAMAFAGCGSDDDSESDTTDSGVFNTISFSLPTNLISTSLTLAPPPLKDGKKGKERPTTGKNGKAKKAGNPPSRPGEGSAKGPKGVGAANKGTPGSKKDRPAPQLTKPTKDKQSIVKRKAQQIEKITTKLNEVLKKINESVETTGTFTDKGPDGKISGIVEAGGDLDYEAIICHDTVQFMYLQFSADGNQLYAVRDFAASPMGSKSDTTNFYSSVYFTKDTTGDYLTLNAYGTPWKKPDGTTDGDTMAEYTAAVIDTNGNFVIQSVVDFFDGASTTTYAPTAADGYMAGVVPKDNQGGAFSVGYMKGKTECASITFDEASPTWCLGKQVGSSTPYTAAELASKWTELSTTYSASVQSYSNLAEVSLPGLTSATACPSNTN